MGEKMNENWSPDEERLSAALRSAADKVTPSPDGLARIRRRTNRVRWWRRPAGLGVSAVGLAATTTAAVLVVLNLTGADGDQLSVQPADPAAESTAESGPSTHEAQAETEEVVLPVYYAVYDGYYGAITREWARVPDSGDLLTTAVHRSLNGEAVDPHYVSMWSPTTVISVDIVDDVIEVNMASPVELAVADGLADEAVQQLVYTATAVAASTSDEVDTALPVRILVDGEPPENLFGLLGDYAAEPITRQPEPHVRYQVQVDDPTYGARLKDPVTVQGVAAAHLTPLNWELRRDDDVIDSGTVRIADAGRAENDDEAPFPEFSIELGDLEPGDYEITVIEPNASDVESRDPFSETKRFTVVEPS